MNRQICRLDEWFKSGKTITDGEAKEHLGIGKFSARITEMRQRGYPVKSVWENGENRFGEKVRYKRYYYDDNDLQKGNTA